MRRFLHNLLLLILTLSSSGCFLGQVAKDGRNFRQALLSVYTEQVMDNLINASENQPFVQLEIRNCIVTDMQSRVTTASNEYAPSNSTTVSLVTSGFVSSLRGFTDKVVFGGSVGRDRTMQFKANPSLGKADVFDYYCAFAHEPSLFRVSCNEPCYDVHIKKKANGRWYWVPKEAAGVFQQLALKTTFLQGPETTPPVTWPAVIMSFEPDHNENGNPIQPPHDDNFKYVVTLDRDVPNSYGMITVALANCATQSYPIDREYLELPFVPNVAGQQRTPSNIAPGDPVNQIYVAATAPIKVEELVGRPISVYATERPNMGTPSPDVQRLEDLVQDYRCRVKPLLK